MSTTLLLLLFLTTAFAATHVNISIAQHPVTNPADVTYVDGKASADLKAGPGHLEKHHSDFAYNQQRSAKLQAAHKNDKFENGQDQKGPMMHLNAGNQNSGFNYDGRLGRVELSGSSGQMQSNGQQQQQGFNSPSATSFGAKGGDRQAFIPSHRHQSSQVRQANEQQEKKNQEFERYIQNYHSGPTVQTVYESASPAPQRYTQTSSSVSSTSSAGPQRVVAIGSRQPKVHTFERLVAVPSIASALLPSTEGEVQTHTIVDHQPKPITEETQQSTTSSSTSSTSTTTNLVGTQGTQGSHSLGGASHGAGGVYDQTNFDQTSYNRPNYDQPQFSYDGGSQPNDFHNQYLPPSVNEAQGGYGGYYGHTDQSSYYGQSGPSPGYLPSQQQPAYHQRPVVTKTIQIAQPALKAKKFEVRHPAIQKEFYDIEERVLIKPAGTIVVELDHPVAKIAKGETIVPLHSHRGYDDQQQVGPGQTHFTSSGPYGQPGGGQTHFVSSGSYGQSVPANNNQYSPSPVYNPNPKPVPDHPQISSTTIASSIAATPTYDQSSKGDFVEAKLNSQFSGEPQFVSTTERSSYSDGKDETDHRPAHVEVNNNGEPPKITSNPQLFQPSNQQSSFNYNANSNGGQASFAPNQPQMQANYNGHNNQYRGEYFTGEYYNNANNQHQQESKPARLQERPLQDSAKVVKHEHNIHLPPVQHNIYLGRMEESLSDEQPQKHQQSAQLRSSRYEEEAARVLEIKPYLQHHNGPVLVYASTKVRPAGESQRYTQSERSQPHMAQYHGQLTNGANIVQYSAPYSNMRYHPEESARYTYGDNVYASENFTPRDRYNHERKNKENLIKEQKAEDSQTNADQLDDNKSTMHHTHIQIKVPQHAHERDQRIMVASTISPPQSQPQAAKYRHSSARNGGDIEEPERFNGERNFQRGDQEYGLARSAKLETKPDCDQTVSKLNGHYESVPLQEHEKHLEPDYSRAQRKFMRLIEAPTNENTHENSAAPASVANIQPDSIDLDLKSTSGHVGQGHVTPGSRVIAATPAPTGASAGSETFHKRRIVVNHPFQTVREVVEHEPITNYHNVQVNEPASPAHYQQPYYHQTHGALRQVQTVGVPVYHHSSSATHGNLQYAIPAGIPVQDVGLTYHHHV